jgi:DNA-binding MarR family transcriptional regulator
MKRTSPAQRDRVAINMAVLRSFRVIYGSVRHHFRQVQRASGVSGSQLWILHELLRTKGIGVSELAGKLAIHQSTCSQLVEKLVRKGYVTKIRLVEDQRRVELAVTVQGRRAVSRAPGPAEGVLPEALSELSRAELRRLQQGLQAVIDALDISARFPS